MIYYHVGNTKPDGSLLVRLFTVDHGELTYQTNRVIAKYDLLTYLRELRSASTKGIKELLTTNRLTF